MKTKKTFFKVCIPAAFAALLFSTALAASGTLDSTFGTNGIVTTDFGSGFDTGNKVILQPDGRIFLLGFTTPDPAYPYQQIPVITRYNSSGNVDSTFGMNGRIVLDINPLFKWKMALQPDGKLVVAGTSAGNFTILRYLNNGALDTSFGVNGKAVLDLYGDTRETLADVKVQPDGKIVAVGDHLISGSNFTDFFVARFNPDGSMDSSFVANGLLILDKTDFPNNRYNYAKAVAFQSNEKIVMSGNMMDNDGETQISLACLNPDGSLDTSGFGINGKGTVTIPLPGFRHSSGAIAIQTDGKIIIAGSIFDEVNNISKDLAVIRFNSNGTLDTTFGGTGIVVTDFGAYEYGADIHMQTDGKLVLAGSSSTDDIKNMLIVRYNNDGTLDSTFGDEGKVLGAEGTSGAGIDIQMDRKILAAGSMNGDAIIVRYLVAVETTAFAFKSTGAYDGWILESSELSNSGGSLDRLSTTFNIGDATRDRQYRSILSFNTTSLPDEAIITSAQVRIKQQGLVGDNPFSTHGALVLKIANRPFSGSATLQAADFSAPVAAGSTSDVFRADTFSWYRANLSAVNIGYIKKSGITQFRLSFKKDDNDDFSPDYIKFFSGNAADTNMPQLIVFYFIP